MNVHAESSGDNGVKPLTDISGERAGHVDSLLNRWLIVARNHPLVIHLSVALLLTLLVNVFFLATRLPVPALLESAGVELTIVLTSLAIPIALTVAALRREFRMIFSLVASGPGAATPVLLRFVGEELGELQEQLGDLRTQGALIDQSGVSEWVRRRCFIAAKGRYLATDSCVPSVFLSRYSDLMKAHADYVKRTGRRDSVRINMSSTNELVVDRKRNPAAYDRYLEWHRENHVALLHLDATKALELAGKNRLGCVVDWSLWLGETALAWEYVDAGLQMRLSFVGDISYRRSYQFVRDALGHSHQFGVHLASTRDGPCGVMNKTLGTMNLWVPSALRRQAVR
jgi:hypothetical protein